MTARTETRPAARVAPEPEPGRAGVWVVVPAYNEAGRVRTGVDDLCGRYANVVVVDDGSTDDTSGALRGSAAWVLRHPVNRGQGAALQTGITFALARSADVIVTFDADGQHDAADIGRLIDPVLRGECDIALGSRFLGRAEAIPWTRRAVLRGGVLFTRIVSGIRVTDVHNGLRAFSRRGASALRITMDGMAHASELLDLVKRSGLPFREVPVTVRYSEYSLAKGQPSSNAIRIALQVLAEKLRL